MLTLYGFFCGGLSNSTMSCFSAINIYTSRFNLIRVIVNQADTGYEQDIQLSCSYGIIEIGGVSI